MILNFINLDVMMGLENRVVYDLNDQVIIQNTEYKVYVRSL